MIKFGVAGYPPAFNFSPFKKNRLKIFEWIRSLGLEAFEAQMTYGPRTSKENCLEIKRLSQEFNIKVSVHASYFIVFTSNDRRKIEQSVDTLKRTYELADLMASNVIVLHPGPLYGDDSLEIMKRAEENLHNFFNSFRNDEIGLFVETAGKKGQLGSVDEIFYLSNKIVGCHPCIDFGHVHARTGGMLDNAKAIDDLFIKMEEFGAFNPKKRIHFHYTPIHFGPKGEISHKALDDLKEDRQLDLFTNNPEKDNRFHPRFERIIENLLRLKIDCTVISEAHNSQEIAAMAMASYYKERISNVCIESQFQEHIQ